MIWRRAGGHRSEERLVREAEGFLRGRVKEAYLRCGLAAPPWAELNWLAHGDPTEIRDRAHFESGLRRPTGSWAWATSILTGELVTDAGDRCDTILTLQRGCLMPMELTLMNVDDDGFMPQHVVALGVPRLRLHPSARRPDGHGRGG